MQLLKSPTAAMGSLALTLNLALALALSLSLKERQAVKTGCKGLFETHFKSSNGNVAMAETSETIIRENDVNWKVEDYVIRVMMSSYNVIKIVLLCVIGRNAFVILH